MHTHTHAHTSVYKPNVNLSKTLLQSLSILPNGDLIVNCLLNFCIFCSFISFLLVEKIAKSHDANVFSFHDFVRQE